MMEDELIKIWRSSPEVEQIKFEKSRLMLDMQSSLNRFHLLLKYGVLIEQIAAIIIIVVFSFYIYWVPPLLSKFASATAVIWSIWYMFRLRKMKRKKPKSVAISYLEYLEKNRAYLKYLKNMTDTAMYWYLTPPMVGYFLFVTGGYFDEIINSAFLFKLMLLGITTVIATYFYIKWIVKKIYIPRLKKIDELIKTLKK